MNGKKVIVAIPARYGSTRFPGKPLALLAGKPVIRHVYEKAAASVADEVIVATDDRRIAEAVTAFGGTAVMTRSDHPSGSDRIFEAVSGRGADVVINVQGDEPMIPTELIDELIRVMTAEPPPEMATVAVPVPRERMTDPNRVKVIFGADGNALYFSRSMIPFLRVGGTETETYRHWGIYAYRRTALERFVSLPEGKLEQCEKLEQLRALENGMRIKVIVTPYSSIGIDTPEELAKAEAFLASLQKGN